VMQRAGLVKVFLGIDAMNPRALDLFNRRLTTEQNAAALRLLDGLGFEVQIGFIMFDPFSRVEDIRANYDFFVDRYRGKFSWNVYSMLKSLIVYDGCAVADLVKKTLPVERDGFEYHYRIEDPGVEDLRRYALFLKANLLKVQQVCMAVEDGIAKMLEIDQDPTRVAPCKRRTRARSIRDACHEAVLEYFGSSWPSWNETPAVSMLASRNDCVARWSRISTGCERNSRLPTCSSVMPSRRGAESGRIRLNAYEDLQNYVNTAV